MQKQWMNLYHSHLLLLILSFSIFQISNGQERSISGDSRNFKLCPVKEVQSSLPPTMDSGRYSVQSLIDGKLPKNGWRSTWTAWMKKNPSLSFDLGSVRRIGVLRIYYQPWDRSQELSKVKVVERFESNCQLCVQENPCDTHYNSPCMKGSTILQ